MEEIKEVRWTELAIRDYINVLNYLESNWNKRTVAEFEYKLVRTINYIKKYPKIGINISRARLEYGFPVTKYNKLIYRIKDKTIIIISIFDTRQNPDKLFRK